MAIKVFIRRQCPQDKQKQLQQCIREIRSLVPLQPGYISSEYLKTIDDSNETLTVSSWFSLEDWETWLNSKDRREIQEKMDAIGGIESEFKVYRFIKTR